MKIQPPIARITKHGMRTLADAMINQDVESICGKETRNYVLEMMVSFGIVLQEQLLGPAAPEQQGLFVESTEPEGQSIEKP